ncbi:MAG: YidC/Oxa1 family membrane protein insertase [Clostridia bacterium]|nr:YidC/Oxa1 family membrane protein insertase [Clostridia bacterium]
MIQSLLSAVDFNLLPQGYEIGLDWLGQFTRMIIEGVGIAGLGIIVFTLVLKAITLPFDIYQRVKMRKQNLIMRSMKEDLDKLQKQFANDKDMYNRKMSELYKKNGYGMLGACLPMILSLVILIVAFQGFRTYSQFANLDIFVGMSESYNSAILEHGVDGIDYQLTGEDSITFEEGKSWQEEDIIYKMYTHESGSRYMEVRSAQATDYLFYIYNLEAETVEREYQLDTDALYTLLPAEQKAAVDEAHTAKDETAERAVYTAYVVKTGATEAKKYYNDNSPNFLWVKNVWYPDVSYNHPIPDYSTFSSQLNVTVTLQNGEKAQLTTVLTEALYRDLTSELTEEKSEANGYFILIVLSIGFMLLSQFIVMRSQKDTEKYQTVDGQAGGQKMMLVIMPLIYGIFAFTMSAAFSIYMTMSSVIALITTVLSNLIIGKMYDKKEEEEVKKQYGRTYAWMKKDDGSKK